MPVVLRSKVKVEPNNVETPNLKSPPRATRRTKRRKRSSEQSDEDEVLMGFESNSNRYNGEVGNSRPFEIIGGLPSSLGIPQYNSALVHPLSVKDSAVLYDSLVCSRRTWVRGEMFELYFTKSTKSVKDVQEPSKDSPSQAMTLQVRDKMQKMCDCTMFGGPHTFPVRLFILKNEEIEKKWQEEQDLKKREREDKKKKEKEERMRRIELKKQQQLQRKQERERLIQMQKENKAKAKMEQEASRQKRKDEMKKAKEEQKRLKKTGSLTSITARKKSPAPSSQSVTDPKMIANLNLMAQRDSKLNALMGIVANGDATLEQVEEFKKFIEIAKKMPPPPGWTPPPPKLTKNVNRDASSEDLVEKTAGSDEKKSIKETVGQGGNQIGKGEGDKTGVANDTPEIEHTSESTTDTIKGEKEKTVKISKKSNQELENNSEEKAMQLTAFQQKYVHGAQIILEYLEYTNSRYMLPKNAIIEFVEDAGDFVLSWIMVHNAADISRHRSKRIRELSKGLKLEEDKKKLAADYDVYSERGCPTPLYTPVTVKLSGIHRKFARIMLNSVDPVEKVYKEMSSIMEIGTRLTGYNLWYQLDAYDDKDLAENLRVELNEHEQEMKGKKQRQ